MNLITELIKEIERQDRVNDIDLSDVVEILYDADKAYNKAIAVTRCCKSDSELLRDKKEPTTWDAFLAGYKKRAEMSGLKYDEVSELHAKTLYKCWNSFDLNP